MARAGAQVMPPTHRVAPMQPPVERQTRPSWRPAALARRAPRRMTGTADSSRLTLTIARLGGDHFSLESRNRWAHSSSRSIASHGWGMADRTAPRSPVPEGLRLALQVVEMLH